MKRCLMMGIKAGGCPSTAPAAARQQIHDLAVIGRPPRWTITGDTRTTNGVISESLLLLEARSGARFHPQPHDLEGG